MELTPENYPRNTGAEHAQKKEAFFSDMRWSHQNRNALLFFHHVLRPPSRVTGSTNMKNVILCYRESIPLDPGRRTDTDEARRKREARGMQARKEGRVGREAWLSARINQPNDNKGGHG